MVANFARNPKGNDRDQVRAITANIGDIAIVNSYYIGLLKSSADSLDRNVGESVNVFFPNQSESDRGAHVNISGMGLLKNSPNKENAIKFIKFLTSEYAQEYYTNNSFEYPVNSEVEPSSIIAEWGDFKIDTLNLNELGINRKQAVEVFEKSKWN
jgi:iron(III) transport system substrate-binding protein